MFANTITLTVNGAAKVLTRINQDNYGSEYRLVGAADRYILKIRHSTTTSNGAKFDQHNVMVEYSTTPALPALPVVMTVSTTLRGQIGAAPPALAFLSDALGVWVAANSAAICQGDN